MRKITSLALAAAMVPALAVGTVAAAEWDLNANVLAQAQTDPETQQQDPQQPESGEIQIEQEQPEVIIDQPAPEVQIDQPPPEVEIDQPEPDVQIEQPEPDVQIQEPEEPDVQFQDEGEPEADTQQEQATGLMSMQAGELEGLNVLNQDGQEIGEVQYIAVEPASGDLYAVLTIGGFWGIGGSDVAMPIDEMEIQGNQLVLATNRTEEELEQDSDSFDQAQFIEVDSDTLLSEAAQQQ